MKKPIHVCMVGYGLHPPWNEGCAVTFRNLCQILKDYMNISVISVLDPLRGFRKANCEGGPRHLVFRGANYTLTRLKGKYSIPVISDVSRMIDSMKISRKLSSLDSMHKIDIVHIFNVSRLINSAISKMLLKKKIVAHELFASPRGYSVGDVLSRNFVDAYICSSSLSYRRLAGRTMPKQKIHIVPPIIDCNVYQPLTNSAGEKNEALFKISYIGNLNLERFPSEVLLNIQELLSIHHDLEMYIYAPDTYSNRKMAIRHRTSFRLNRRLHIVVSNLDEEEKISVYNTSNVIIFPYSKEVEEKSIVIDPPLAVLEGMASGRIVIASRVLSLPDLIENGINGFLYDPENFESLMKILTYAIEHYEDLEGIQKRATATIQEQNSPETIANKILGVYASILK